MASICRLCLNSNASHYETIAAVEEKYFELILPEIDIQLVSSPVFCQSCIELLQTTYSFKSTCIETEKMLKLYASTYGETQLLLNTVLQNEFWNKIQMQFGNNDPRELLNKDVKMECENDSSYGCDFDMSDDEFSCSVCQKSFDSEIQLCHHGKVHKEQLKCKICSGTKTHTTIPDDKKLQCQICELKFDANDKLVDHLKSHFEKPKCLQCEKRFYNVSSMRRHLARVHKVDIDVGEEDDTSENWRDEINFDVNEDKMEQTLNKHLDLFENPAKIEKTESSHEDQIASGRPFKCELCNKSYNVRSCLLDHLKTHMRRPTCKLCNKSYYNMHCLKRHMMQLHKIEISTKIDELNEHIKLEILNNPPPKYTCETCSKQFGHKSSFDRHKLTHTGQKTFICDFCQKGFLTKTYLERHISVCHLGIRPKRKLERNFTCDTCGLTTNNKHTLIQHIRIHTGERPYKCDICDKAFAQSSSLGTHKRTVHSTERLFTCEYCSKSFNAKGSLTKHILEVHLVDKIEKKFVCNFCGKKYRLQSQLNSHLKWHMADRQFSCDICGKPFVDKHSVKKHRVTHFAEKQHKCEICGKGFHQKYNIKIHMKVHSRVP